MWQLHLTLTSGKLIKQELQASQMLSPALCSKTSSRIILFSVQDMAPMTPRQLEIEIGAATLPRTRTWCKAIRPGTLRIWIMMLIEAVNQMKGGNLFV
jgi:hypothetical protein